MYGPPKIPATGGGWITVSASTGTILSLSALVFADAVIISLSLALITLVAIGWFRLRLGESKLASRGG